MWANTIHLLCTIALKWLMQTSYIKFCHCNCKEHLPALWKRRAYFRPSVLLSVSHANLQQSCQLRRSSLERAGSHDRCASKRRITLTLCIASKMPKNTVGWMMRPTVTTLRYGVLHATIQTGPYILGHQHYFHLFGPVHHQNGFEMTQTKRALSADTQLWFEDIYIQIRWTV